MGPREGTVGDLTYVYIYSYYHKLGRRGTGESGTKQTTLGFKVMLLLHRTDKESLLGKKGVEDSYMMIGKRCLYKLLEYIDKIT